MPAQRALIVAAALAITRAASADPQVGATMTLGGGSASIGDRQAAVFHAGARGDVLLLRARESDMGVGPFVAIGTEALRTVSFEAGAEWLVPAGSVPFVFAAGAFERNDSRNGYAPGVLGSITWGPHGYNFEGPYSMSAGLFVEARRSFGPRDDTAILGGVAIDLSLLAYPFLLAYGALAR